MVGGPNPGSESLACLQRWMLVIAIGASLLKLEKQVTDRDHDAVKWLAREAFDFLLPKFNGLLRAFLFPDPLYLQSRQPYEGGVTNFTPYGT